MENAQQPLKSPLQRATTTLTWAGALVALGIVFGDIGTSPLYVMSAILRGAKVVDRELVLGALSCIIWTLTLQTTLKYVVITLRADNQGEGGVFALYTLVRKGHGKVYLLAILGSCALLADGIITPSITVTSAIEGLSILMPNIQVIPIVVVILSAIFAVQRFGTARIGRLFGPVMTIWFAMLGVLGILALRHDLTVLEAFNPIYAIRLLRDYPGGFVLLGAVFLATTGAEALYSDLGHCGAKNIRSAWIYVKVMLIINYLGQGSWILAHHGSLTPGVNPFFAVMPTWFLPVGVGIATMAAIIASQALITGSFTLISEAIRLSLWPRVKLVYPTQIRGQIYIPFVNNFLWVACLLVVFHFQSSDAMQAAYGLSITLAMLMTTTLLIYYFRTKNLSWGLVLLFAATFYTIEGAFFLANITKFFQGAWITVSIMALFALIMYSYFNGLRIRERFVSWLPLSDSLPLLRALKADTTIPLCASNLVFITASADPTKIERKTLYSIFHKQPKRAEHYWLLHVETLDDPYTFDYRVQVVEEQLIYHITLRLGFKQGVHVYDYFNQIITTMEQRGQVILLSPHPSLAAAKIRGDLLFILIERTIYNYEGFTLAQRTLLKLYQWVKRLGQTDLTAYEIDPGIVWHELVPLQRGAPRTYPSLREIVTSTD